MSNAEFYADFESVNKIAKKFFTKNENVIKKSHKKEKGHLYLGDFLGHEDGECFLKRG